MAAASGDRCAGDDRAAHDDRVAIEAIDHAIIDRDHPGRLQRTVSRRTAELIEPAQCQLGARRALGVELEKVVGEPGRRDIAVEHHRANAVGKQRRVRRAQDGAVRETQVVELALAERGAEYVDVPCHVLGTDLGRERAVLRATRTGIASPDLVGERRPRLERVIGGRRRELDRAIGRLRTRGPARIEADDIEALAQRRK